MNKFQRASAGMKGAIENTLDDLRHNWERTWYGRDVTGDVNMFPASNNQQPTEINNFYGDVVNNFYNYEPPEPAGHDLGQDIER